MNSQPLSFRPAVCPYKLRGVYLSPVTGYLALTRAGAAPSSCLMTAPSCAVRSRSGGAVLCRWSQACFCAPGGAGEDPCVVGSCSHRGFLSPCVLASVPRSDGTGAGGCQRWHFVGACADVGCGAALPGQLCTQLVCAPRDS